MCHLQCVVGSVICVVFSVFRKVFSVPCEMCSVQVPWVLGDVPDP